MIQEENQKKQLKATRAEKVLYELHKKALDLLKELSEYKYHSRGRTYIAFDCKVTSRQSFPDREMLESVCDELNLTPEIRSSVIEHFTDEDFYNIREHVIYCEIESYKEFIAGYQHNSREYIHRNLEVYSDPERCQYPSLKKKLRRCRTQKGREKAVWEFFKNDIEISDALEYISPKDLNHLGRSGGHMAIAEWRGYDCHLVDIEYALENLFVVRDGVVYIQTSSNRADWWAYEVEYLNQSLENIIKEVQSILKVLRYSEELVDSLNKSDIFRDQMMAEVEYFIEDHGGNIYTDEHIDKWMERQAVVSTGRGSMSFLRLTQDGTMVETSQGVKVDLSDAKRMFMWLNNLVKQDSEYHHKACGETRQIGPYIVQKFVRDGEDYTLRVGCHQIRWSHITRFATKYLGVKA